MIINTTATMVCTQFEDFWLSKENSLLTPFVSFVVIFILICSWSCIELFLAANNSIYSYRKEAIISNLFCIISACLVLLVLRAQWEHIEYLIGERDYDNLVLTKPKFELPEAEYFYEGWEIYLEGKFCEMINEQGRGLTYEEENQLYEQYIQNY